MELKRIIPLDGGKSAVVVTVTKEEQEFAEFFLSICDDTGIAARELLRGLAGGSAMFVTNQKNMLYFTKK